MNKVKLYFPEYYEYGEMVATFVRTKKTASEDFTILLGKLYECVCQNDLQDNFEELFRVAVIISNEWRKVEHFLDNGSTSYKSQAKDAETLSNALQKIINRHGNDDMDFLKVITEIRFKGGHKITSPEIICELLGEIDFRSKLNLMIQRKKLLTEHPEFQKNDSITRNFICSTLWPFFNYLKAETSMTESSENEIYRFIHTFSIIVGVDLESIYTQKPEEYLRSTFRYCKAN